MTDFYRIIYLYAIDTLIVASMTFILMKCQLMKEIICVDAMYQSTAHAERFVHLPGRFEPPTYTETLASTLYLPVL